jgi:hypothetical protein
MELCYICRQPISPPQLCRRVLPVLYSRGVTLSAPPGVGAFTHYAPVSLCPACDAEAQEQYLKSLEPGWLVKGLLLWLLASLIYIESRGILTLFTEGAWIRGSIGIAAFFGWGVYKTLQKRKRKVEIVTTGGLSHGKQEGVLPS